MKKNIIYLLVFVFIPFLINAQAFVDVESGLAITGYNNVKIPAEGGTAFSLAAETPSGPVFVTRLRIGYTFKQHHTLSILAAPLTVEGNGTIDNNVIFQDKTFLSGSNLTSRYRFDSYRITYRWDFIKKDDLLAGIGITAKLRSADIALMDDTGYAHREDLGVVPLINFRTEWFFYDNFGILLDGDALVTPFGRAEDINLAVMYSSNNNVKYRIGYRLLEGGSDGGGNVYTFSMFHYITAGVTLSF
ncbi:hypothetical protein EW093_01475 [Thiospirochaeta perfilievii]|uniref:DUF481 domain-containing protein n=1 Tax=Thiospirochaeta perfilievii TaxID=252967 RepID=A0A5C1Q9F7_9SPIO|nr:hypothetical protein [Thiospirochaeta perfilievii]QEN03426.1 hypothetical protein EW093_01475 [Thiospirochaeta perfilievii]